MINSARGLSDINLQTSCAAHKFYHPNLRSPHILTITWKTNKPWVFKGFYLQAMAPLISLTYCSCVTYRI